MGVLDWGGDRRREGAVLGVNFGSPIATMGPLRRGSSQITVNTCYSRIKAQRIAKRYKSQFQFKMEF